MERLVIDKNFTKANEPKKSGFTPKVRESSTPQKVTIGHSLKSNTRVVIRRSK